jgi:hypothetical protein
MSFNTALNTNVVKTALDGVFMQEWDAKLHPGYVDASSSLVFNQDTSTKAAEIFETFGGIPLWDERSEEENVSGATPRIRNQKTFTHTAFAKSIDIPKHFFDDNMHGSYEKMVRDFAQKGITTRDQNAFALFRLGFTTATTADGVALFSASHTTTQGETVSNLVTGALSESTLNDAIVDLVEQKDEAGVVMGNMPSVLLVPPALFKTACQIVKSELRSGTANNDVNVYSSMYNIYVATTPRIGAAAGGSDTAWFLLAKNHGLQRFVRQGIVTDLVDYKYQRNNTYIYKGEFREVVGAMNYAGVVGSTGL